MAVCRVKKIIALCLLGLVIWLGGVTAWASSVSSEESGSAVSSGETASGESTVSESSAVSLETTSSELEFTNMEPSFDLPEPEMRVSVVGILAWAVLLAAVVAVELFVHAARVRDRQAFRDRSAARSRWRRHGPVRTGMSEKIHHDRTHMRR